MSVVGSEPGMDARRVDADSSGARDGVARLSVRPFRGVELRGSGECGSATRAAGRQRAVILNGDRGFDMGMRLIADELEILVLIFRDRRRLAMNGQSRQR